MITTLLRQIQQDNILYHSRAVHFNPSESQELNGQEVQ